MVRTCVPTSKRFGFSSPLSSLPLLAAGRRPKPLLYASVSVTLLLSSGRLTLTAIRSRSRRRWRQRLEPRFARFCHSIRSDWCMWGSINSGVHGLRNVPSVTTWSGKRNPKPVTYTRLHWWLCPSSSPGLTTNPQPVPHVSWSLKFNSYSTFFFLFSLCECPRSLN
jgi:hypothetical protein